MSDPNGIEVIVLQECRLNGPDHRTLGDCFPGDRVIVARGIYANELREKNFVAFLTDFPEGIDNDTLFNLHDLDAALRAASTDEDDEGDGPDPFAAVEEQEIGLETEPESAPPEERTVNDRVRPGRGRSKAK